MLSLLSVSVILLIVLGILEIITVEDLKYSALKISKNDFFMQLGSMREVGNRKLDLKMADKEKFLKDK